jgi:hypothetical protein
MRTKVVTAWLALALACGADTIIYRTDTGAIVDVLESGAVVRGLATGLASGTGTAKGAKTIADVPDFVKDGAAQEAAEAAAEADRNSALRLAVTTNLPALRAQALSGKTLEVGVALAKVLDWIAATEARVEAGEAKAKASAGSVDAKP